jgi:hypothetical protein
MCDEWFYCLELVFLEYTNLPLVELYTLLTKVVNVFFQHKLIDVQQNMFKNVESKLYIYWTHYLFMDFKWNGDVF